MPLSSHPKWTAQDLELDLHCILRSDLPLHIRTRWEFVDQILWKYVEIDGKYKGCPLASPAAIQIMDEKRPGWKSRLRLDHAVPRTVLVDAIIEHKDMPLDRARAVLSRLAIAVVLTVEEDSALGKHGRQRMACGSTTLDALMALDDVLGRYRLSQQAVVNRATGQPAW